MPIPPRQPRDRRVGAQPGGLDPGRATHLHDRRGAVERQARRRVARADTDGRDPPPAAAPQRAVLPRPGHRARRPRRVRAPLRELEDHPVAGSDPEHPGLVRIYKSPDKPNDRYENAWHTDATWREKPPFGCVLRCVECPPVGGDTMWANMVEAYARLPEHVKEQIAGLRARHSIEATFGAAMPIEKRLALKAQFPDAEHPVVRTHPETGEKVLFVNAFATHFTNFHTPGNVRVGQDYAPGASQLLQYLVSQAFIPEYQVRFRWRPNSVAFWDNRATQHYAVMDYPPCHRKMERAGIVGDIPY